MKLPKKFQFVFSVVYYLQKVYGIHADSAAKDGLSEQSRGFEQVNCVNHTIHTEPVNAKL